MKVNVKGVPTCSNLVEMATKLEFAMTESQSLRLRCNLLGFEHLDMQQNGIQRW